jgi:hypothetical protein
MAWPEVFKAGMRVEFRGEYPHRIDYATITKIEEGARDMEVLTDDGKTLTWPTWSERVKIAQESPDKKTPTVISFSKGKPQAPGDYLCIRKGNAHPEYARIRTLGGALIYMTYSSKLSTPLDEIEDDATFSAPILTIFV